MKKLLLILSFILIALSGCKEDAVTEPDPQPPIPPAEVQTIISGTVSESSGLTAIASKDISVTLFYKNDSLKTLTDNKGKFTFKIEDIEIDTFTIVAKSDGYGPESFYYADLDSTEKQNLILTIKESYKTISGVLTEKDGENVHPSADIEVFLISNLLNMNTVTDNTGRFSFKIATKDFDNDLFNSFTLYISEPEFTIIDTLFFNENKNSIQDISLQLIKLYSYFPLKIGNNWEYEAETFYGDSYNWKFEGNEKLEIKEVFNDSSFTVLCTLNGVRKYSDPAGSSIIYLNNKEYILNVRLENGKPIMENCDSCSSGNYPVIGSILLGYTLDFNHPASADTIKVEYGGQWDGYNYSLIMNIGLTNFESSYFDGTTGKSISYKLINYDLK